MCITSLSILLNIAKNDIFGSCPTQVTATPKQDGGNATKWKVVTTRDLVVCDLSYVSKVQQSSLSFIQVMMGGVKRGPIAEVGSSSTSHILLASTVRFRLVRRQLVSSLLTLLYGAVLGLGLARNLADWLVSNTLLNCALITS